jgi:hypothetical protein
MNRRHLGKAGLLAAAVMLSACAGDRDPSLLNIAASNRTPDEFAILPTRPLETPPDYAALPPPTPDGANRVDPQPRADAVAALGGNPDVLTRGAAAADAALLSHAARNGVTPGIRTTLAAEDLEFRRRNDGRILERLFNVNVYFRAYEEESLDQHREVLRWRRAGARTPSAPPDPEVDWTR